MQCRCGNTIDNVPEHLRDLATWTCQKCTNLTPKAQPMLEQVEQTLRQETAERRRKKAA